MWLSENVRRDVEPFAHYPRFFNKEIADNACEEWHERSLQSHAIGLQLAEWRRSYAAVVEEFIAAE